MSDPHTDPPLPPTAANEEAAPAKVPNSPTTAFAALSLTDTASSSIFTSAHLAELDAATALVSALDHARTQPKPLIRSTGHMVSTPSGSSHHLLSWKVAEFAYRKSTKVGSELPTLARGLFTERLSTPSTGDAKHRIVVRGYDKFFNLGELAWTKPASIAQYTTAPYVLTFKENGCIIFVAALSPTELVVTSKHSLGSQEGKLTHAHKGHEWLRKHLASVGRTETELASELWTRNETAAFELCDDSFEEHVLAYSAARSGLHLHGLNVNGAAFRTRGMDDVDAFAKTWGFIPTRWITLPSLDEVHRVTAEIEQTGAWDGEPIEGFVIRTHMPHAERIDQLRLTHPDVVSPPYAPGQAWFYKVKFDEPYLMYRDWRELARKMLTDKQAYDAKLAALPSSSAEASAQTTEAEVESEAPSTSTTTTTTTTITEGETPSKAALKRERKRLAKASAKSASEARLAAQASGLLPPSPPQPRSRRPETLLFVQWCYDRLYGNAAQSVRAQPHLFAGLAQNKGIIAMRNAFLDFLATHHPSLPSSSSPAAARHGQAEEKDAREVRKTILAPIAVPGCGKTVLALALQDLFGVGLVQSDDFKKKGGFLTAVERELRSHADDAQYVLFADKNNHLRQHRDELVALAHTLSSPALHAAPPGAKKPKKVVEVGRVRTVALAWELDLVPLNTLHRVCSARIERRGDNHQTLVADPTRAVAGLKSHESVLWRFLEALQPFDSAGGTGDGGEGYGDAAFDRVVKLHVGATAAENLRTVVAELAPLLKWEMPTEARMQEALQKAQSWKVAKKAPAPATAASAKPGEQSTAAAAGMAGPRYFGLAVELDVRSVLDRLLSPAATTATIGGGGGGSAVGSAAGDAEEDAARFYARMRASHRLNLRPHITLVHRSNLSDASESGQNEADRKWAFYTALTSSSSNTTTTTTATTNTTTAVAGSASAHAVEGEGEAESAGEREHGEAVFTISITTLLYDRARLLTFPISSIDPPASLATQFQSLHATEWTPHITVCTASPDIPPYEANHTVQAWLNDPTNATTTVKAFQLPQPISVEARIFGMS